VARIARLFAGRARAYLGDEATEAHAKALDRDARYVHFACHGYLDERFPLNSALALSIPDAPAAGGDNGLLQAWEIFDKVRIDAELVTLSACGTALGKDMGGEGLLGLTRAFHYAGARSVLATLWSVSDMSTALLMERLYTHLRAGQSRDEALRAAQLDFIRGRASSAGRRSPDVSHPFHWAALQLSGDWR
jgi:CHAT domain-containing protein